MRVRVFTDVDEVTTGEPLVLSYRLENLDAFDHATNATTVLNLPDGIVFVDASSECSHSLGVVTCLVDDLEPTAPGEGHDFEIEVSAVTTGSFAIDAAVTADEIEAAVANTTTTANIEVVANLVAADMGVEIFSDATEFEIGDTPSINFVLTNASTTNSAQAVELTYTVPEGASVEDRPNQCGNGSRRIVCSFGVMAPGEEESVEFDLEMDEDGVQSHTVVVSSNNELNPVNNTDILELIVGEAVLAEETDPEDTTEEETAEETDAGDEETTEGEMETDAGDEEADASEADADTTDQETDVTDSESDETDVMSEETVTDATTDASGASTEEPDGDSDVEGTISAETDQEPSTTDMVVEEELPATTTGSGNEDSDNDDSDNESEATASENTDSTVPSGGTAQANSESSQSSGDSGGGAGVNLLSLLVLLLASGFAGVTRRKRVSA